MIYILKYFLKSKEYPLNTLPLSQKNQINKQGACNFLLLKFYIIP